MVGLLWNWRAGGDVRESLVVVRRVYPFLDDARQ
jgi:hypothetical protein